MEGAISLIRKKIKQGLEPFQFAVCMPGGCEMVASVAHEVFDGGASQVFFDIPALNRVHRGSVLSGIRRTCPGVREGRLFGFFVDCEGLGLILT